MKTTIIYVPGILDDIGRIQSTLVSLWKIRGVHGQLHSMPWAGTDDYDKREARLIRLIESTSEETDKLYLMGASAGGSAVLNAYSKTRNLVDGVCLICPKINNPYNVGSKISEHNPSFITALEQLQKTVNDLPTDDKKKILLFLSPRDGVISRADSAIPGVAEFELASLRHNAAILYSLTIGFPKVLTQLKQIQAAS